jgi:hypothetical protein
MPPRGSFSHLERLLAKWRRANDAACAGALPSAATATALSSQAMAPTALRRRDRVSRFTRMRSAERWTLPSSRLFKEGKRPGGHKRHTVVSRLRGLLVARRLPLDRVGPRRDAVHCPAVRLLGIRAIPIDEPCFGLERRLIEGLIGRGNKRTARRPHQCNSITRCHLYPLGFALALGAVVRLSRFPVGHLSLQNADHPDI